jgi:hypothetical protein
MRRLLVRHARRRAGYINNGSSKKRGQTAALTKAIVQGNPFMTMTFTLQEFVIIA